MNFCEDPQLASITLKRLKREKQKAGKENEKKGKAISSKVTIEFHILPEILIHTSNDVVYIEADTFDFRDESSCKMFILLQSVSNNDIIHATNFPPLFAGNDTELEAALEQAVPVTKVVDVLGDATNTRNGPPTKIINIAPSVSKPLDIFLDVIDHTNSPQVTVINATVSQPSSSSTSTSSVAQKEPLGRATTEIADENLRKLIASITEAGQSLL